MQLQLKKNVATKLELRDAVGEEVEREGFELYHRTLFSDSTREFVVQFKVALTIGKAHALLVEYSSFFETNDDFDADFKESSFVNVNAPAIAFPFIRSYIAHITLIGGYESVILPSVNYKVPDSLKTPKPSSND